MESQKTAPTTTLMDLKDASLTSGVPEDVIEHLLLLHIIEPVTTDPGEGPLFSVEQTMLLEILTHMDGLDFRIEEMRDMVRAVDTLCTAPHSELAAGYRIRLGAFTCALSRRTVVSDTQARALTRIAELLGSRYPWLSA